MARGGGPDLGARESFVDPTRYFARFRADGPVQWSDAQRAWVVIGHAAAQETFAERDTLSADRITSLEHLAESQPASFQRVVDLLRGWMIFRDPPAHGRLREPVRRTFTSRHVSSLRPTVERIAQQLVDALDTDTEVDLHARFTRPFPALVIGALLGLDDVDPVRLQDWSDTLAGIVFAIRPPAGASTEAVVAAADAFEAYFGPLVDEARHGNADHLVARVARLGDDELSDRELVGLCTMLLFAGHETTTGLLGNSLALLFDDGELLTEFRRHDPAADLQAVDELLRVAGPARTMVRRVAVDHERAGRQLREGEKVFVSIAAANHDPEAIAEPERIDLGRDPNPHLGFGWGLHHCLGSHLARLESAVALRTLLRTFPSVEPTGAQPPPGGSVLGLARMPTPVRLAR